LAQARLTLVLAALACACACTASPAPREPRLRLGELAVVAEGPCPRLSAASAGGRTLLLYGETGYDLHDWGAGERLAAAQTLAEVTASGVVRDPRLLSGLPRDARGYVPGSLLAGSDGSGAGYLLRVATRYAPRGTGSLFVREHEPYELTSSGWVSSSAPSPLDLGPVTRGLPEPPLKDACEDDELSFVPLSTARARDGSLFVAGRCQDDSHIAYHDTTLVVLHAAAADRAWGVARLPRTQRLSGIVNVDVDARSATDARLVAYEPFEPPRGRHSYYVEWDGRAWRERELGVDAGLMSVAADSAGRTYLAASAHLYRVDGPNVVQVRLPPLSWVKQQPELHVHSVSVLDDDVVWVEASYRARAPAGEKGEVGEIWASALFSNAQLSAPLYCDARELADAALSEVEGVRP
jgi:hypothetical protein